MVTTGSGSSPLPVRLTVTPSRGPMPSISTTPRISAVLSAIPSKGTFSVSP